MIGIIGGSGLYDPKLFKVETHKFVQTPYGTASDRITIGKLAGKKVAFLARHGEKHTINPSRVNYRANIFALKKLGCTRIIAVNAVGSLQPEIKPGTVVFPDQFIDRTHKRETTFYNKKQVCHINVSEPFCKNLRKSLTQNAENLKLKHHRDGNYICIEGPRFSTRAESNFYRSMNGQIIGMTLCPEATLAREAELCYANIATVTDYDNLDEEGATLEKVLATMKKNTRNVKKLLEKTIQSMPKTTRCKCQNALEGALL